MTIKNKGPSSYLRVEHEPSHGETEAVNTRHGLKHQYRFLSPLSKRDGIYPTFLASVKLNVERETPLCQILGGDGLEDRVYTSAWQACGTAWME